MCYLIDFLQAKTESKQNHPKKLQYNAPVFELQLNFQGDKIS